MPPHTKTNKASDPATKAETPAVKDLGSKASQSRMSTQEAIKPKDQASQPRIHEKKVASQMPGLKRDQSDIFKAFSKPHTKVSRESTSSSIGDSSTPQAVRSLRESLVGKADDYQPGKPNSRTGAEFTRRCSENENVDEFLTSNKKADRLELTTRSEREEQLRNMMDEVNGIL
ncbi:MAG: hypothetical protein Q9219_007218 [cf. Caloplaca sp. 3 TL-2023]